MTQNRTLLRLIASVLLFWAGIAGAQNIASNPGFETGDTSDWFGFGTSILTAESAVVHSGNYAALVSGRTATWNGIAQSFDGVMQSGGTYTVSVWLQLQAGSSQSMQATMQQIDGNGTNYLPVANGNITAGSWTQITGQFTLNVTGTLSTLTLYFEMPSSATVSYYIDDLSVVPLNTTSGQCAVDWTTVFQHIDGFGASSAWRSSWTSAQANMFFSANNGTGTTLDGKTNYPFTGIDLSFLRSHIVPANTTSASDTPSTYESSIMTMAQSLGARVWSTPWTPPTGFKGTNDIYDHLPITNGPNGGNYLGSGHNVTNINYASQLANYVASMKSLYGVNIYAVSMQNEPDANINTYEACQWSGQQFHDFATNLYAALVAKGFGSTKILFPESEVWSTDLALQTPAMTDAGVAPDIGIVADHNYDNGVAVINNWGKPLWETEVSTFDNFDGSISNGIYWAQRIHSFLTEAQVDAWHFWWLIPSGGDNEGLTDDNGYPAKRMYVLGNYSRFVRPNYYRINVTNNAVSQISAFKDSASDNFAIVAINPETGTLTQTFNLTGVSCKSVTPWVTSATLSLASQASVTVTNNAFTYALPAQSVVTFVGQGVQTASPLITAVLNGSSLTLSWPVDHTGWTLLSQTNHLTNGVSQNPADWMRVTSSSSTNQTVISISPNDPRGYYRLVYP
jgi:glucuronoarabinoxylan endo-1,4-beta-xylanase